MWLPCRPRSILFYNSEGRTLGMTITREILAMVLVLLITAPAGGRIAHVGARGEVLLVNIRDFGAIGNGRTDDTAAIQAAIDYAYKNHLQGIFCPSGNYVASRTIYLDPPGNLRANLRSPPLFSFSLSFVGEDEGIGNGDGFGCSLRTTFNDKIAFMVGPGQHMAVRGIAIIGPNGEARTYRGNLPSDGVGIGIAGGNGGAHHTIIENTYVENFYSLYATNANGSCCLSDSNNFVHVTGANGYIGILLQGTQSHINRVEEPTLSVTIGIKNTFSHSVIVTGGNISAARAQSDAFGISSIGNFSTNGNQLTFTGVIASPDVYIPHVYTAWMVVTPNFGVIPLEMTNWNSRTNTGTFRTTRSWSFANAHYPPYYEKDIANNVSTIYAAERIFVFMGDGFTADTVHVENPFGCTTYFDATHVWNSLNSSLIRNPIFNYDIGFTDFNPANGPSNSNLADFYCQETFPFIAQDDADPNARLEIDGGTFTSATPNGSPVLIEQGPNRFLSGKHLNQLAPLNLRIYGIPITNYYGEQVKPNLESTANGAGEWDEDYFLPRAIWNNSPLATAQDFAVGSFFHDGGGAVSYYGYRPAPGEVPDISQYYSAVTGALGGLGTYPPIDCQTVYRVSSGWNAAVAAHINARSAHCPGYSYGQNLTDALIGGAVQWHYVHGSSELYLDGKTITWMFPGLALTLPQSPNPTQPYVVTGVYPELGYVTVMDVSSATGTWMQGTGYPMIDECKSQCVIGQAAYAWKLY
jgi:pectate lyase-like protein